MRASSVEPRATSREPSSFKLHAAAAANQRRSLQKRVRLCRMFGIIRSSELIARSSQLLLFRQGFRDILPSHQNEFLVFEEFLELRQAAPQSG